VFLRLAPPIAAGVFCANEQMPLIKSSNVPRNVLPFSITDIEVHARKMLAEARARAEELLVAAQAESDTLRRQAFAQGLAEGKKQGHADGMAEGKKTGHDQALAECKQQLAGLVSALSKMVQEIDASRCELEAKGLGAAIELAIAMAQRVTKRQTEIDTGVLTENLKQAMALIVRWADVRIAVNPKQLELLKSELPALQATWPQLKHVDLIDDATISRGGCRIFTAGGSIDGDMESQLDRVIQQAVGRNKVEG
jgi:flagellar assembly protein FliH